MSELVQGRSMISGPSVTTRKAPKPPGRRSSGFSIPRSERIEGKTLCLLLTYKLRFLNMVTYSNL